MLRLSLYVSVTASIVFATAFAIYTHDDLVKRNQYPPMLWGSAIVACAAISAAASFPAVAHLVAVINKMISHLKSK